MKRQKAIDNPPEIKRLIDLVCSEQQLRIQAGGSKTALHFDAENAGIIKPTELSGIIAYDPDEYTITAWAGTPVREILAALAENSQTLPFDPLFVEDGATLGGTIAANTAGSGRYRYGGVRDFLIGITFVSGGGELVRGGGRVVKNASGFDLPKFMVGSLGRYGVLLETTWKVFPLLNHYANIEVTFGSLTELISASFQLAGTPFDLLAQDWRPESDNRWMMDIRLGGGPAALPDRLPKLTGWLKTHATPLEIKTAIDPAEDRQKWAAENRCAWQPAKTHLVKIPIPPKQTADLDQRLNGLARRYTAAGNTAWVAAPDVARLSAALEKLGLAGLVVRGTPPPDPIIGHRRGAELARRVKSALDPKNVFGEHY